MFKNYLRITLRYFIKHKAYTFINVAGLAVGIACCVLILLYIRTEVSYDKFHENYEDIYRVVIENNGSGKPTLSYTSYPLVPNLLKDFPEIKKGARFFLSPECLFRYGDARFKEGAFLADADVFDIFTFPMLKGDPETALAQPNSIVITESVARKYFGNENPMGQTLASDVLNNGNWIDFNVTGVVADVPANSHLQFDVLLSFHHLPESSWNAVYSIFSYVLLPPDYPVAQLQEKLQGYSEKYGGENAWYQVHLQPLSDVHLYSNLGGDMNPGSIVYVIIFSAIAVLILLIACINFMNLSTARAVQRAEEVGVRKVVGAARHQLIKQFLAESVLMSLFAGILAVGLLELMMPVFQDLTGRAFSMTGSERWSMILMLLPIILFSGLVAGSYPAFVLSALRPADIMKRKTRQFGGVNIRKAMVVFQFVASIALTICTLVVFNQMAFARQQNLGFAKEQILVLPLYNEARDRLEAFRLTLQNTPGVVAAGASSQVPTTGTMWNRFIVDETRELHSMIYMLVDENFLHTYDFNLLAGREFRNREFDADVSTAFILNRAAAQELDVSQPIEAVNREIERHNVGKATVVGVIENFHVSSLHNPVRPIVLIPGKQQNFNYLSLKIDLNYLPQVLSDIENIWQTFVPNYPFEYFFLDEAFAQQYENDANLGQLFGWFAGLAIFVACLGLLGLASLMAESRTKEIGVRKVLGASTTAIVSLLSKDFVKLIIIANIFAWPIAWYAMNRWLENFAYRAELGWEVFVVAGCIALVIALFTISVQAIRAALANPVESLRYE